jgi:hypothetical protein
MVGSQELRPIKNFTARLISLDRQEESAQTNDFDAQGQIKAKSKDQRPDSSYSMNHNCHTKLTERSDQVNNSQ